MIDVDHTIKFSTVWYNNIILLNIILLLNTIHYSRHFVCFPVSQSIIYFCVCKPESKKALWIQKKIKPYILYLSSCLLYSCRYIFIPEWKLISPSGINSTFAYLAARGGATIWGKFRVHESLHSFCNTFFKVKL